MKDRLQKFASILYLKGRPLFSDIGTAFIGVAALFFVRGFPQTASIEFDPWLMGVSFFFFLVGLLLRVLSQE